jgi:formate C-acetyltransferase
MGIPSFGERCAEIRRTKLLFNDRKLQMSGHYNSDDHGWIPVERVRYERFKDEKSGLTTGMDAVSRTFCAFLDAHPAYVHPHSAIAGAWAQVVQLDDPWRPEERRDDLIGLWEKYNILSPGVYAMNHVAPDMEIGLSLGFGGLLEKIRHYRTKNRPADAAFYDGEERLVLAIQRFIRKHAAAARAAADAAGDEFIRQNMTDVAAMNEYLADGAPRTLREAVQFLGWFQAVDRMYYLGGALQELDELLRPYYEADLASGRLSCDDEAVWYIVSLLFNDTHYSQIGGQDPASGRDLSGPMSFIILEAMHRLKIPANIALRLHENTNEALFTKCVEYLFEDGTGVSYSCSGGLDAGYMRNGHPPALARMRAKVGCNWTALPGIEYSLQDVTRLCLAKPMVLALNEMMVSGDTPSMKELLRRYEEHLSVGVGLIKEGLDWHLRYKQYNRPELVLNLFAHGPIERGLDMSAGGVDIVSLACDGAALATVADSLAAIEQRVEREGALTWTQLHAALSANFSGHEDVRRLLKNVPRFGSGNARADEYAQYVAKLYTRLMRETPTKDGYTVLPGIFSHGEVYALGKALPATANGRYDGDPISHSADPDPGFLPGGGTAPTAKANAVARVQSSYGNSTPLQIDLDAALAREIGGVELIKAYLRAHNDMGGTLININVVSKEKLLEAHEDPDKYPDLVVRVTGYSAFFKSLSKEYRQQVVDRWVSNY